MNETVSLQKLMFLKVLNNKFAVHNVVVHRNTGKFFYRRERQWGLGSSAKVSFLITEFFYILITVNVTNVTCRGCYHFRWSETSLGSL